MFMMFFRLFFFCLLTVTNVAAAPHQLPESAITRRFADGSGLTNVGSITSVAGTLDGNGNGGGDNDNGNTNGENGNNGGHNLNGDASGNTIIIPRTDKGDSLTTLTGVLSGDGNGNGGNGNSNTNGENGNNNGDNGNGDASGNAIIIPRTYNGDSLTTLTGVLSGDGNGNGGNGNGNTSGENGNNNGGNGNGDASGNTIIIPRTVNGDSLTTLTGVLSGNGNDGGDNGNDNTNGENGNNNGHNLNGDGSGNTIVIGRTVNTSSALTGVESADGNGNGGNGNNDTNGENGSNDGHNGNGDLSGNTIV